VIELLLLAVAAVVALLTQMRPVVKAEAELEGLITLVVEVVQVLII
jgi:hypothetical protein